MSVRILVGDCLAMMATLPENSVDCVVTSPPYFGLRDYGVDGQMGLEPSLAEHLAVMVDVFREVRRVLKPSGTVWLNYGDCYATSPNGRSAADTKAAGADTRTFRDKPFSTIGPIGDGSVLKPKDLCMIPNRLAIALQDDGWWVRSEIIWGKPNPMPESIKDRPATSHEKIFMLTKAPRYGYDAEAVQVPRAPDSLDRYHRGRSDGHKWADGGPGNQSIAKSFEGMAARSPKTPASNNRNGFRGEFDGPGAYVNQGGAQSNSKKQRGRSTHGRHTLDDALPNEERRGLTPRHEGQVNHTTLDETPRGLGRNLRNYEPAPLEVWSIATRPFGEAHFATFPPELASRCIKAGCPDGGLVLDPFAGAGTTGLVADRLQRDAILIELNPEYAAMAEQRIAKESGLFGGVSVQQLEAAE